MIGAVPIKTSDNEGGKIRFQIEDGFDKQKFHKKTHTQYLVDGRLKEWGSGGRDVQLHKARVKELQMQEVKASQITQQTTERPLRTATVRYMAKAYIEAQMTWNKDRDALISSIVKENKSDSQIP